LYRYAFRHVIRVIDYRLYYNTTLRWLIAVTLPPAASEWRHCHCANIESFSPMDTAHRAYGIYMLAITVAATAV